MAHVPSGEMESDALETARPRAEEILIGAGARRLRGRSFSSQKALRQADPHAFVLEL